MSKIKVELLLGDNLVSKASEPACGEGVRGGSREGVTGGEGVVPKS